MHEHRIEGVGDVDADELLALLNADNVHEVGSDELGFSCLYVPGHVNGDRNPSCHINRESLLWRCKSCGRAGNLLELVRIGLPDRPSFPEAMAWLREHFGEVVRKPRGGSLTADLTARLQSVRERPDIPQRRLPNEADTIGPQGIFALDWRSDHEAAVYMRDIRRFAPEVLEDWGLGYDTWTGRVAIPVRDVDGTLVGFKGRALRDGAVKYLLLGDTADREPRYGTGYGWEMHDHRQVLFGVDRARGHKRVALVEGELDAVACHAAGVPAVAPGTTSITTEQLWLMRAHFDEVVLFYDSDKAGEDAVWGSVDAESGRWRPGWVEKISPYFTLLVCDDHEGDPASMAPEQVRALVAGARHWLRFAIPSAASV
jgi:DNA primase